MVDRDVGLEEPHGAPAHEVVAALGSHAEDGLGHDGLPALRDRFGPNRLPPARRRGALLRAVLQLHHPLIYVLLVAAATTAVLGEVVAAAVIAAVVVINRFRAGVTGRAGPCRAGVAGVDPGDGRARR